VRWPDRRLAAIAATSVLLAAGGSGVWLITQPDWQARLMDRLFGEEPTTAELAGTPDKLDAVTVHVNASDKGSPISPYIYGVAGADPDVLLQLGATLNRWGGNPSTRYNWANGHAWNAARDWEFRNVNYGNSTDSLADAFVRDAIAQGVTPLLTVPMGGWVARDDRTSNQSLNVPIEGGAPLNPGSQAIAGYDPTANRQRTSVRSLPHQPGPMQDKPDPTSGVVYQDEWINHLVTTFGARSIKYLAMDNEPDLWSSTHTDVHPVRMSYNDMLQTFEEYATAVKGVAPSALILGPDVSGWTGYWYSDLDRGSDNFATHADRRAHADQAFLPWWLAQVAKKDRARGNRSLDLLDVHYYPQASGVTSSAHDPKTQYLRIQSVRGLYDPSYIDPSWIGQPVMLIPRLKTWIKENYPGTGLAITEYKWGGAGDASGAVAQAEVLGIFGREGVDVAAYWTYPKPNSPAGAAFRLYRNFDGRGAHFGDRSLPATSSARSVRAFAARDSKSGAVDVLLVNESFDKTANAHLDLNLKDSAARLYQLPGGSSEIEAHTVSSWRQTLTLSPLSVTLLHIPAGAGP
jgi:hypothetical protein